MTDWSPIDTADTADIILGCDGVGEDYHVYEMVWDDTFGWRDPQWDGGYNPTHWMPRPQEPGK